LIKDILKKALAFILVLPTPKIKGKTKDKNQLKKRQQTPINNVFTQYKIIQKSNITFQIFGFF